MSTTRSKLGSQLFKLAAQVYEPGNEIRKELGNMLFKLAAKVSPDKPAPTTKKLVGKKKTK